MDSCQAVLDLRSEQGGCVIVCAWRREVYMRDVACRHAGDVGAGRFAVTMQSRGTDHAEIHDITTQTRVVAVSQGMEKVGVGHRSANIGVLGNAGVQVLRAAIVP